jgi:hypothetical protein
VKEAEKKLEEVQKELQENTKGIERVNKNVEELRKEVGEVKIQKMDTSKFMTTEEYREQEARRNNLVMHRVNESAAATAAERREADMSECSSILREAGAAEEVKEIKTCRRIGERGEVPRLVMHRVNESAAATAAERREADMRKCRSILREAGAAKEVKEIKTCRRIGERGEVPRPLIVVMKKEVAKLAILEAAKNLKNTAHSEVSIMPDLTPQQRQEETELGGEAERRNREEHTEDDRQKNLSWQVVGQRVAKRLIKTFTRQRPEWQQRGAGQPARGRGRTPAVPQPAGRPAQHNGPTIPRTEMLPEPQNRKRGRDYRLAVGEKSILRTTDSGEEMEEQE